MEIMRVPSSRGEWVSHYQSSGQQAQSDKPLLAVVETVNNEAILTYAMGHRIAHRV
jgi:hypothetical protein